MNRQVIGSIIGIALLLAGLLVSETSLFQIFGGGHATLDADFSNGALVFKLGLIAIGLYILSARLISVPGPSGEEISAISPSSPQQDRVFLGLLVVAGLLRFYQLDQGIWIDEMLTFVHYMPLSVAEIVGTFKDPNNHLLFSVLARISLSAFGDSIWAFRLPAVIFGIGSIAALYYFGRRVTNTNVSLLAAALLTFSYHHIWFSQNARGYTILLFFTLASSAIFLDALQRNDRRTWLLYAVTAALGVFTHLTIGFVLVAHFLIYVVTQLKKAPVDKAPWWIGLYFGFVPLGLLSVQAHALILPGMLGGSLLSSGMQGDESEWTNPLWGLMEVVNGMLVSFTHGGIALFAAVVFGIGMLDFARKRPAVVGLFLIPVLLGLGLMLSIGYTLFPRFFFFAMGFGVIVTMQGAAVIGEYAGRFMKFAPNATRWMPTLFCAVVVAASLPSLRYVHYPKQDFAGAIDLIEREKSSDDTVVTIGIAGFPFNDYHKMNWENIRTIEELNEIESHSKRTWLIYTMPVQAKSAYPEILDRISQDYELVRRFHGSLNGGDILVSLEKTKLMSPGPAPGE